MVDTPTLPIRLSRTGFLLLCVAGLIMAALFATVPVSVDFSDDPLLRLQRLDPQLTLPQPTAECGSPVRNVSVEPASTDLYDVARANACEEAARRRVSAGLAAASICVALGLLGLYGASTARRQSEPEPVPILSGPGLGERDEHGRRG